MEIECPIQIKEIIELPDQRFVALDDDCRVHLLKSDFSNPKKLEIRDVKKIAYCLGKLFLIEVVYDNMYAEIDSLVKTSIDSGDTLSINGRFIFSTKERYTDIYGYDEKIFVVRGSRICQFDLKSLKFASNFQLDNKSDIIQMTGCQDQMIINTKSDGILYFYDIRNLICIKKMPIVADYFNCLLNKLIVIYNHDDKIISFLNLDTLKILNKISYENDVKDLKIFNQGHSLGISTNKRKLFLFKGLLAKILYKLN